MTRRRCIPHGGAHLGLKRIRVTRPRRSNGQAMHGSKIQLRFARDMKRARIKLREYRGRWWYFGLGVTVPWSGLQRVMRATRVGLQWDDMGFDAIVYPRTGVAEGDMEKLMTALEAEGIEARSS